MTTAYNIAPCSLKVKLPVYLCSVVTMMLFTGKTQYLLQLTCYSLQDISLLIITGNFNGPAVVPLCVPVCIWTIAFELNDF